MIGAVQRAMFAGSFCFLVARASAAVDARLAIDLPKIWFATITLAALHNAEMAALADFRPNLPTLGH